MTIPADLNKFLHALANDNRQRIMLLFAETHVMTVGVVAERTNLGMSTVSEHLKQLKEAGLLRSENLAKKWNTDRTWSKFRLPSIRWGSS